MEKQSNKKQTKKIFLVRHTSLAISPKLCYGRADIDVAETFAQEAQAVVQRLGNISNAKLFSSPLQRTRKLANYIAQKNNITKIEFDDDIIEIDYGSWEMKKWDEIDPQQIGRFFRNIVEEAPAGGESFSQVVDRVVQFWQKILKLPNEEIVVVCHGGVLKAFMSVIANINPKEATGFLFDYGGTTEIEHIDGFNRVRYVNRT